MEMDQTLYRNLQDSLIRSNLSQSMNTPQSHSTNMIKIQDPGISNFVTMNLSGRFAGREILKFGQRVIKTILTEKQIGLFFGQQTNFRPNIPIGYEYIGNGKAFLIFDRYQFKSCDEKQYRQYLRDLELQDRLPRNYLPDNNFVICKMRSRKDSLVEFIAMSWVTDECMGNPRAVSYFRKVTTFLDYLSQIEEMPVILAGTFRLGFDEATELVPDSMCVCSYEPHNKKREMRQSNLFVCSSSLKLADVKPIVCSKLDFEYSEMASYRSEKWLNPEDAFYWDPVLSTLVDPLLMTESMYNLQLPSLSKPMASISMPSVATSHVNNKNTPGVILPLSSSHGGAPGTSLAAGDNTVENGEVDGPMNGDVMKKKPAYAELYDEDLIDTNALISEHPRGLSLLWKLERLHLLMVVLIDELYMVQKDMNRAQLADQRQQQNRIVNFI